MKTDIINGEIVTLKTGRTLIKSDYDALLSILHNAGKKIEELRYGGSYNPSIIIEKNRIVSLDVSYSELQVFSGVEKLTGLNRLDLRRNRIKSIEGIENLVRLELLDLGENEIRSINGIEKLTNLQILCLGYNQISNISGLETLTKLRLLHLIENPLLNAEEYIKELRKKGVVVEV